MLNKPATSAANSGTAGEELRPADSGSRSLRRQARPIGLGVARRPGATARAGEVGEELNNGNGSDEIRWSHDEARWRRRREGARAERATQAGAQSRVAQGATAGW